MKKLKKIALTIFAILVIFIYFYWVLPVWGFPFNAKRHTQLPLTPAWVLENWLWEDDVNTAEYVDELLEGYAANDIPIRTIIIDSPWSLRYNDFEIDTTLYPQPTQWFKQLEDKGYRVVLWMTPMVNKFNKDTKIKEANNWYNNAINNGYLVPSKKLNNWWKGDGGFVDYTNPVAVKWWRGLQQNVFDLGIDGWKLDGAATLFWTNFGLPIFYKKASTGWLSTREYMDLYYREEYKHGLTQNPEFVTLSRSIDNKWIHPEGFAPFDASPINWVGDQTHTWESTGNNSVEVDYKDQIRDTRKGIGLAVENVLESAKLGYNLTGSDIAGFSGSNIPPKLYMRWAQFSTFCGLFMNGGHGERRLWKRTNEELEVIRKFSWLHTELVPYMYHYVVTAHNGGRRLQTVLEHGKYHYLFGDYFLVAPIVKDSNTKKVNFPKGEWRYFFNDSILVKGEVSIERDYPMDEFPVYVKEGAIIPLNVINGYTHLGDTASKGFITLLIYPHKTNEFVYYHTNTKGKTTIRYEQKKGILNISLSDKTIEHILSINSDISPVKIRLDNKELLKGKFWNYDSVKNKIRIKTITYNQGNYKILF